MNGTENTEEGVSIDDGDGDGVSEYVFIRVLIWDGRVRYYVRFGSHEALGDNSTRSGDPPHNEIKSS